MSGLDVLQTVGLKPRLYSIGLFTTQSSLEQIAAGFEGAGDCIVKPFNNIDLLAGSASPPPTGSFPATADAYPSLATVAGPGQGSCSLACPDASPSPRPLSTELTPANRMIFRRLGDDYRSSKRRLLRYEEDSAKTPMQSPELNRRRSRRARLRQPRQARKGQDGDVPR